MLLEEWLNMETSFGELGDVSLVQSKLPKKLKKRRQIVSEDGPAGYVTNLMFIPGSIVILLANCQVRFFVLFKFGGKMLQSRTVFPFLLSPPNGLSQCKKEKKN